MTHAQILSTAKAIVDRCMEICPLRTPPTILVNPRMTRAAGRAFYIEHRIVLSANPQHHQPEFFENTVIHEYAHLLAYQEAGGRRPSAPHGKEWKDCMRRLGVATPKARFGLEDTMVDRLAHRTVCGCGGRWLTPPEHYQKTLQRKARGAVCRCCKSTGWKVEETPVQLTAEEVRLWVRKGKAPVRRRARHSNATDHLNSLFKGLFAP